MSHELLSLRLRAAALTPLQARIAVHQLIMVQPTLAPTWRACVLQALNIASGGFGTVDPYPDLVGTPDATLASAFVSDLGYAYLRHLSRCEALNDWSDE